MNMNHDKRGGKLWHIILISNLLFVLAEAQQRTKFTIEPREIRFNVEGDKVVYRCTVVDVRGKEALDVEFVDGDDLPYKNSTNLTISVTKYASNYTTIAFMIWDPISVQEVAAKNYRSFCKATGQGINSKTEFHLVVIPKDSVPTIEIEPTSVVPPKHGSDVKLICKASTVISAYVYSVETKWSFENFSETNETLPKNAVIISDSNNRTHAVSELVLTKVSSANVGKYYCSALLHITKPEPKTSKVDIYFKSVKIGRVIIEEKAENSKEEVETKKGDEKVQFDCKVLGSPPPTITWKKDNAAISASTDSRYNFSVRNGNNPAGRYLTVKDPDFNDKGVYVCYANRTDSIITKVFRLRVRDPFGALWPFIGIVAEAVLLFFIIGGYELYKRKRRRKPANENKNASRDDVRDTSPLVSNAPGVSYSSSRAGVRIRTANSDN